MKLSTQILLGFLIAISIDLADSYINYSLTLKVTTDTQFLTRSETTLRTSERLREGMSNMQSAFRGFLLTGDEDFLTPYRQGLNTLPQLIADEMNISSSPAQRAKLDSILYFQHAWVAYANTLVAARKGADSNNTAATQYQYLLDTRFRKQLGKSYTDSITALFGAFEQYEYRLRDERRSALTNSIRATERSSLIFSILIIITGLGLAYILVSKISSRIKTLVRQAENITAGDFTPVEDTKSDELTSLSASLNTMSRRLSRNITELKKRNDELDQFAYVVSHDLKAPVRGISNVVHWIEEDLEREISPKMREYLDIIPTRITRMESLIDGLLRYARVGREQSIKEDTDVTSLIDELGELIVPKEYTLATVNLPKLRTEKLLLQQVFSNLLSNAVKYTPAGSSITISAIDIGNHYEFSVSDNGPGIDGKYHEKIFVIFQTLRERHDNESTGVGLSIVKKIVEDRNCSIRVVSAAGKGTSFIFTWSKEEI
ncbi:MAG TPA: ATP-binding protein [Puia sp.]|jgi:signal transduction histidine kinase